MQGLDGDSGRYSSPGQICAPVACFYPWIAWDISWDLLLKLNFVILCSYMTLMDKKLNIQVENHVAF